MGVPALAQYYFRKYNRQHDLKINIDRIQQLKIYSLFFDYNSLIHPCAYEYLKSINDPNVSEEFLDRGIIQHTLNYTLQVIKLLSVKQVYIVIDGVAPRSKMIQQRERRYKSYFFKKIEREQKREKLQKQREFILETLNSLDGIEREVYDKENKTLLSEIEDVLSKKDITWDSNKITPGTSFMSLLNEELYKFKETWKHTYNIIISTANECGEGEHKIMKILEEQYDNDNIDNNCTLHCIYGLDADLLMLSLLNKCSHQIILLRDNSFRQEENDRKQQDDFYYDFVDISILKQYICEDIKEEGYPINKYNEHDKKKAKENYLYDYILLCFLLGNDFLEHLPGLSIKYKGIDIVLNAYNKAKRNNFMLYLVDMDKLQNKQLFHECINLHLLKDIFYYLNKFVNIEKYGTVHIKEGISIESTENMYIYTNIHFENIIHYHRYYNLVDCLNDACYNYIEGLYWVLGYYKGHIHKNWTWYYKYENVPTIEDIFNYLLMMCKGNILSCQLKNSPFLQISQPYSMLKQLCLVLPKESLTHIIPLNDIQRFKMNRMVRSLKDMFPSLLFIDLVNKEYLWQSKVCFKEYNEELLDMYLVNLINV